MPAVSRHLCRVLGRGVVRCKPKIFQQQAQVVDLLVSRSQKKQASSTAAAPFPFPHPLSSAHSGSRSYVLGLGPTNCYAPVHNPLHGALVAVSPSVQSQTGGLSGGWPAAGLHTAASPLLRPRSSSADAAAAAVDTAAARSGSAARSAEEVAEYVSRTRTRSRRSDQAQPTDAAGAHGLSPRRAKARYCTSQEVKVIVERYIDNAVAIGSTDLKPIYLPMPEEVPGITKRVREISISRSIREDTLTHSPLTFPHPPMMGRALQQISLSRPHSTIQYLMLTCANPGDVMH